MYETMETNAKISYKESREFFDGHRLMLKPNVKGLIDAKIAGIH